MKLIDIKKSYGKNLVFDGFNLDIEEGKITVILGESGCGKTTLLEIICGFINDYTGEVKFEDDISNGISYIFQDDALIPWKTVHENMEYVLKDKLDGDLDQYIIQYLKMVKLGDYANEYPQVLSGGMKRRVGIARAFAFPARYLLMDEPFEFLDLKTKTGIIKDFKKIQKLENKTVIFITHDIESAVALGDNIVMLGQRPAKIIETLYDIQNKVGIKEKIEKLFL